jgi:hypothetical protein
MGVTKLFSALAGDTETNFINYSDYTKPLILDFDRIIYSGPDGRFYQSNFDGTRTFPFTYVKEN